MDQQTRRIERLAPGTYVIAVSGGVDSVVLLDILNQQSGLELIVAHFDHGIRQDSAEDAQFVGQLAKTYGYRFVTKREELGKGASEELARTRRYEFLRAVTKKHTARLITAHHADDIVETVAINLLRGTGWRGLAVLDSDIIRPMLAVTKAEVHQYATKRQLTWHEDSTNSSDVYLRNRVRRQLGATDEDLKWQIISLRAEQKRLKQLIKREVEVILNTETVYSRYFFVHIDEKSALELLRDITKGLLTHPRLIAVWLAIKTARANTTHQAGSGVEIDFTSRNFTVKLIK